MVAKGGKKKKNLQKKKKEAAELTPEERFAQLQARKQGVRCLLEDEDVYQIYASLVKDFAELGEIGKEKPFEGCEQCASLSEECAALAEEWKKKLPAQRKVESRTVTTTMREREEAGSLKKGKGKWILLGMAALMALAVVCCSVPLARYQAAGVMAWLGFDSAAADVYAGLGDYADSKGRVARLEEKMIAGMPKGSRVRFGDREWILLDRQGGRALLSQYAADDGHPFHDKREAVTWERSSLRNYLNGEFLHQAFSAEEESIIEDSFVENGDNPVYGTDGGRDTTDKLYLMSEREYKKYKGWLKGSANAMRLRTPGRDAESTMYVSVLGKPVAYGFPVDENGACIRPVMWVRYEPPIF